MSETATVGRQQILPFYMVCDESWSMEGEKLDSLNAAMGELHQEIGVNPVVADKTRFSIIGFSNDAEVLQPLADLSQLSSLPILEAQGGTNFGAAFRVLKQTIESDVAELKAQGHVVYRPVVFFLTDGFPQGDWSADHQALVDDANPLRPKILAFGTDDADADVIRAIATFRAFVADGQMKPAAALSEFAGALTKSIVKSGSTASPEGMTLQTPENVPGFKEVEVDAL